QRAHADDRVLDQRRLVDDRRGEPRDSGALCVHDYLGVVGAYHAQRRFGQVEAAAHAETPTSTSRNRACAAPCETCASCPGWPFPQFVSPKSFHSSGPATASSLPQKTGVT